MQVEIPCEGCRVPLRVPPEAAGHRARCPACGHTFVVPKVDALMEDTVSHWIEEDVEQMHEVREREAEERTRPAAAAAGSGPTAVAPPPPAAAPHRGNGHDHDRSDRGKLWPMRSSTGVPGGATLPPGPGAAAPGSDPDIEIIVDKPPRPQHRERRADAPSHESMHGDEAATKKRRYPGNLHVDQRVPHLIVHKVDAAGVHFGFDQEWLKHDGFRASFPVRCAFSGTTAREKLLARPMIFMDRANGQASAESIHAAHENREIGDRHARDITRSMGIIENMPRPFAYAMPYYVSSRHAHKAMHCRTRDRLSGGITCEVIVPDAATALDWLGRVNGVCGEEYRLLEEDASLRHGDAWQTLSDEARSRIESWCKLAPREMVRHYFADADFGKRDEGLAGLILTDHRLVYCKYHHKGQASLDSEGASVIAKPEGRFASLTLRTGNDLHRMVKIHANELDRLGDALRSHGKITLQVVE